jgi:hypothetical protein
MALLVVRVVYASVLEVNSDEPQHLHVVWAWTQGLLPYRDVFDNHAPLFAVLYAPLLQLFGERSDIVSLMRLANLPWYAITLWTTYRVGRVLFDRWVGFAAAAITAVESTFFLKSVEFRPDMMWAAVWMLALTVALEGRFGRARLFLAGLLAGVAFAVSIKTSVLLAAAGIATLILFGFVTYSEKTTNVRKWAYAFAPWMTGVIVAPATVVLSFSLAGAGAAMRYCLVEHNIVPGIGRWSESMALWRWVLPLLLIPLAHAGYVLFTQGHDRQRAAKRAWLMLATGAYLLIRDGYQPLITGQDLLPWIPMVTPFAAAGVRWAIRVFAQPNVRHNLCNMTIGVMCLAEAAWVIDRHPPWRNDAAEYSHRLDAILTLTQPGSTLLDTKGDAIFRPRATYWIFENVTLSRFQKGLIREDVSDRLASCHVAVVTGENWPQDLAAFIQHNYLAVDGRVFIAGKRLGDVIPGTPMRFDTSIPQRYAFATDGAAFVGEIDGIPYAGPRVLTAGQHRLVSTSAGSVRLQWAGSTYDQCSTPRFSSVQVAASRMVSPMRPASK